MLPFGGLYATYHLLREPETTIDTHTHTHTLSSIADTDQKGYPKLTQEDLTFGLESELIVKVETFRGQNQQQKGGRSFGNYVVVSFF